MCTRVLVLNGQSVVINTEIELGEDSCVLVARRPDSSLISRQVYARRADVAVPQTILESAALCLYPNLAPHNTWGHGCMG